MWITWAVHIWLVVSNAVALSFTVGVAVFYRFALTDVGIQIGVSQLGVNAMDFFPAVIVAWSVTSAIHILVLLCLLCRPRRVVARISRGWNRRLTVMHRHPSLGRIAPATLVVAHESGTTRETRMASFWSTHSAEITRLFMLWEVSLQTFQAYKISYLVASVSINRLVALVIVTNCWFSPLLHYAMGNRPAAHVRLGRLLLDSSLDLIYNVGIPLTIFYPYYRDFNGTIELFPFVFYYDDTWYVNALSELRQIFVTSWPDFVSKLCGSVSLVYRLWKVQTAVDNVAFKVANTGASGISTRRDGLPSPGFVRSKQWHRNRLSRLLDLVLLLWGASILALHLTTTITSLRFHDPDCLLEMRPWVSLAYSCSSFEISCSKRRTPGDRETMNSILTTVDPLTVANLILSNCPQLHVPTSIQSLRFLTMIKIYNSTVASWDAQAALHHANHPQLQVVYLVRVNASGIPEGLLADDLPRSLWDIEFCITNISTFPSAITKAWEHIGVVAYEVNPDLTEFPEVLTTMPNLFTLLVGSTNITTIRDGIFDKMGLVTLGMNRSPIDRLPDSIGRIDQLQMLLCADTKIATIPTSWMDITVPGWKRRDSVVLYASGSPLCASNEVQRVTKPMWLAINCEVLPSDQYTYPLEQEEALRVKNQ